MKFKFKYPLSIWQRISIPFLYIAWLRLRIGDVARETKQAKESFSLVLSGMISHEHDYIKFKKIDGLYVMACSHPGCNLVYPLDEPNTRRLAERLDAKMEQIDVLEKCIAREVGYPERQRNFNNELEVARIVEEELVNELINLIP